MKLKQIISGSLFAAALAVTGGVASAQVKIALDSPPDLEGSEADEDVPPLHPRLIGGTAQGLSIQSVKTWSRRSFRSR